MPNRHRHGFAPLDSSRQAASAHRFSARCWLRRAGFRLPQGPDGPVTFGSLSPRGFAAAWCEGECAGFRCQSWSVLEQIAYSGSRRNLTLGVCRSSQSSGSILRWWMRWTRSSSMRCDTACFTALHRLEASGRAVVRRGHPSSSRALLRTHRRSTRPSIGFPIKLLSTVGVRSPPSSETPCGSTSASALHLF